MQWCGSTDRARTRSPPSRRTSRSSSRTSTHRSASVRAAKPHTRYCLGCTPLAPRTTPEKARAPPDDGGATSTVVTTLAVGAHGVLVDIFGKEGAGEIIRKNPGVLACNPKTLSEVCCAGHEMPRTSTSHRSTRKLPPIAAPSSLSVFCCCSLADSGRRDREGRQLCRLVRRAAAGSQGGHPRPHLLHPRQRDRRTHRRVRRRRLWKRSRLGSQGRPRAAVLEFHHVSCERWVKVSILA